MSFKYSSINFSISSIIFKRCKRIQNNLKYKPCIFLVKKILQHKLTRDNNMNTFNHIGMLLFSYLALYAAFRSGKSYLKYKRLQNAIDTANQGSFLISTNSWSKMIIWLGLCFFSIVIVFKIAPTNEIYSRDSSVNTAPLKP